MKRLWPLIAVLSFVAVEAMAGDCSGWAGFQAPVRYASSADRVVLVRDLDGDGAPEIIASGNHVDELPAFSILPNRGDGTLCRGTALASGFGEKLQDVGDLNHDGVPDLLVSNYWSNGIAVYLGKGRSRSSMAGTPLRNGDARRSVADRRLRPRRNAGRHQPFLRLRQSGSRPSFPRTWRRQRSRPKTTFDTQLANGDWPSARMINGALEILVSERSGHLGILRFANGVVTVSTIAAGPGFDMSSTFADVNGDGIADIVDTERHRIRAGTDLHHARQRRRNVSRAKTARTPAEGEFSGRSARERISTATARRLVVSDFQSTSLFTSIAATAPAISRKASRSMPARRSMPSTSPM